jgi:hypothetical protein
MTTLHPTETAQIIPFGPRPKLVKAAKKTKEQLAESVMRMLSRTMAPAADSEDSEWIAKGRAERAERKARRVNAEQEGLTDTCKNQRMRNQRKEAWHKAWATEQYWSALHAWHGALEWAQRERIPDALTRPAIEENGWSLVGQWRDALMQLMLTPAATMANVEWKRAKLRAGQHVYTDIKVERLERAIAADVAFLTAHPARKPSKGGAK